MKYWLKHVVYAGHVNENSAEVRKHILISSLFSIISFILLIIYGIDNLGRANYPLASVVLVASGVSAVNYLFLCKTGKYRISSIVIVFLMTLLALYLVCTGGNSNTGPLWMFVLPALTFYILGLRPGLIYLSAVFAIVLCILLLPDNYFLQAEYPAPFTQRFIGALFSVVVIGYVNEYSREDGRKELVNLSNKLDMLSRKDELTGLSNRRDMFERLRDELSRLERSGRLFSVLIADIDHFKSVNDNYGHECGDLVLKRIAETFAQNTQKRDTVARWGGEEFLIFLPETNRDQAVKTAERLRRSIEALTFNYEGQTVKATTSIGVAEYVMGQTLNELINTADKFLYLAKREGRNRVKHTLA